MSPPPYVDISITPAPVRAEPSVWDLVEWFDGDATLLGWNYGPAPVEANKEVTT
jgi:hypothetical protein